MLPRVRLPLAIALLAGCGSGSEPTRVMMDFERTTSFYDAPFPSDEYTAGARQFPTLVPTSPDDPASEDNRAAWAVLQAWEKPVLCAFSDKDPITGGADRQFLEEVPGTAGQPHTTIEGGGHFLQEDRGPELAAAVDSFIAATPRS